MGNSHGERGIGISEERARELLEKAGEAYRSGLMRTFPTWVRNYDGPIEEKNYLEKVLEVIHRRNGRPNTRVYWFDSSLIEEILSEIGIVNSR